VVVFSSSAHRKDIARAYELGANGFVVKPASTIKRAELAKAMGLFWLEFNEVPPVCTEGLQTLLDESKAWQFGSSKKATSVTFHLRKDFT